MGILIVQFAPPSHAPDRPRFCNELGIAVALLREAGVDVALTAMTAYERPRLRAAITAHRPAYVLMDVPATRTTPARHTIADIAERHYLPVVLVGRYATCQPEKAISIPGVAAMIQGEYEPTLPRLLKAMMAGPDAAAEIPGVWLNSADGLLRNPPAPMIEDVDALPFADRDIFEYARTVEVDQEATFYACRGCRNWCAHCLNDWYLNLYDQSRCLRRRDPRRLLDEVVGVTGRYGGVKSVAFAGHAFATDAAWLEAFADEYSRRTKLPYRCRVAPNALHERTPDWLARSGCRLADVEIGSGSNFIREE
ncbi:MAG: radical SAM protein, partial [Planctomycetota bacterium]